MPAPAVVGSGATPDNVTTTQVVTTESCNVGDTLYIAYGTDAFDVSTMPEATSDAGTLAPIQTVDLGTNLGHQKTYLVVCTTAGVKHITFPAHSGADIHGHYVHVGEACQVDGTPAQNLVTTNSTASHIANGVDPAASDALLICTWLTTSGPTFTGHPYTPPGSMTARAQTGASPFSAMLTATEALTTGNPTGTRTATWIDLKRYMAATVALSRITPGGAVTSTLALASSAVGSMEVSGAATSLLNLFSGATGLIGGGAAISDVLCGPWATVQDVPAATRTQLAALTDQQLQDLLLRAAEILWALSGRRWYGQGCTETATLRSFPPHPGTGAWPYHNSWGRCGCWGDGLWIDGRLLPAWPDWHREHYAPYALRLPRAPLASVVSVTVDGVPFTSWRLVRQGWIERTDGLAWRLCDDSTSITYTYGEAPPAGGRDSAVELGVELAKAQLNLDDCRLPVRTTSVTRQGVSYTVVDPFEFLDKGKTGLPGVDLWLAAVNPQATPQAATVWSPDIPTTLRSP